MRNCCDTPALPVSLERAAGEPKPSKSRSEVEVTINLCFRYSTGLPLPCLSRQLPRPHPADRTPRRRTEAQPPESHPWK